MTARRRIPPVILAAIAVAVLVIVGRGGHGHQVSVTLTDAVSVVSGQQVRIAGRPVGSVKRVETVDQGRRARIVLDLDDDVWPLRASSRMALRWGGTISYDNRYIALLPGRAGPTIADGGEFPTSHFQLPVELDSVVDAFDARTRAGLTDMLQHSGIALHNARGALRSTLGVAPPAIDQADRVLADLGADDRTLSTLVRSGDRVVGAALNSAPNLAGYADAAAAVLDATGSRARALNGALATAPASLVTARATLRRADTTLTLARATTRKVAPGVTQVRRVARPLSRLLANVVAIAPDANGTLQDLNAASPKLDALLSLLTRRLPQLRSISDQTVTQLHCIRPYTPDIVSWFTNWGGFMSGFDGVDRYLRANVEVPLAMPTNVDARTPAQAVSQTPGLTYAFPRPPGYNAGQPWFLPECGAGRDALNPADDPEIKHKYTLPGGTP